MPFAVNRNKLIPEPIIILAFLFFHETAFSQITVKQDTTLRIPRGTYVLSKEIKSFVPKDTVIQIPGTLIKADSSRKDKTITFYDSLKVKASRTRLTKALFDMVIVSPDTVTRKKVVSNSQESFKEYSGKKIRKIQVQRLNVFGADVNNPGYYNPHGAERLLNSTHINTNENIIRKYLLFSEGDTLSPLTLSDNERIIRQLPFIDDARIIVVPVSDEEADIIVVTKDVYSLGADFDLRSAYSGTFKVLEKNVFGFGHEFDVSVPYSKGSPESPGIGLNYIVKNIHKSFVDLDINYYNALGTRTYGAAMTRNLVSSATKYAGGITIFQTFTTADLDTLPVPQPLKYTYQDYWFSRSFLINKEPATRIISGIRYTVNNVFARPLIDPNSFHSLQKYRFLIGSAALSVQKYYKTNLIYNYGRTEDIPAGMLLRLTAGSEINEFNNRAYTGLDLSYGHSSEALGYFYTSAGFGTYIMQHRTNQGVLALQMKYFSNLLYLGSMKIRNFVNVSYTRGYDRNNEEYLTIPKTNGFSGFANDSLNGDQRLIVDLESVVFNPVNVLGFRFAFFGFADMAFLAATNAVINKGNFLTGFGIGIRIRNDNLIFKTFQIRLGFFPGPPQYSVISNFIVSGEQLLRPNNFDSGPPAVIPYQ